MVNCVGVVEFEILYDQVLASPVHAVNCNVLNLVPVVGKANGYTTVPYPVVAVYAYPNSIQNSHSELILKFGYRYPIAVHTIEPAPPQLLPIPQ